MHTDGQKVYILLNQNSDPRSIGFNTGFDGFLTDVLNDNERYDCHGWFEVTVPAKSSMILIANDGSFSIGYDDIDTEGLSPTSAKSPDQSSPAPADTADELIPEEITPGRYRHFKGNEYEVIDFATDSETGEKMVIYRALYGEHGLWVRPYDMFREIIERDGKRMRRFEKIG